MVKPVSVAVGWSDPRTLQEDFLDAYPQSVFSTDRDPFATAAKYPDGPPNVFDSLRYSTFSEVSVLDSHIRQDVAHTQFVCLPPLDSFILRIHICTSAQ